MSDVPPNDTPRAARFKGQLRDLLDDPGIRLFVKSDGAIRMEMDPTTVERMIVRLDAYEEWREI